MNTTKKLLIGAAALLAIACGMQAEDEKEFIGDRHTIDYKNAGLKEFKIVHRVYNCRTLDLSGNDLGELVLPVGMIDLHSLNLRSNNNLTNLFIQMDTSIDTHGKRLSIYLSGNMRKNLRISLPSWLEIWGGLDGFKEAEIRPNGVELVRYNESIYPAYKNQFLLVWGDGVLQQTNKNITEGKWQNLPVIGSTPQRWLTRRDAYGGRFGWRGDVFYLIDVGVKPSWDGREGFWFLRLKPDEPTPIPIPVKEIE